MRRKKIKPYTEEDIAYIRKWYGRKSAAQIAKHIKHSLRGVQWKVRELGLNQPRTDLWTEEQVSLLRRLYGTMLMPEIARRVGKSAKSIAQKSMKLGLTHQEAIKTYENEKGRRVILREGCKTYWSPQMISTLRRLFPVTQNSEVAQMCGVSDSVMSRKARELGLKKNPDYVKEYTRNALRQAHLLNKVHGNKGQWQHRTSGRGLGFMAKYIKKDN